MNYRAVIPLGKHTMMAFGLDHALGQFIDVVDSRYAEHPYDLQGEGYLLEWSEAMLLSGTNLIGVTLVEMNLCAMTDDISEILKIIIPKVEAFINTLPDPSTIDDKVCLHCGMLKEIHRKPFCFLAELEDQSFMVTLTLSHLQDEEAELDKGDSLSDVMDDYV